VCDAAANRVAPLPWQGSGDLCTLAAANCLCCFPAGHRAYAVGETLQILWI
jgi:molybdopterin biosynthesis enzyme